MVLLELVSTHANVTKINKNTIGATSPIQLNTIGATSPIQLLKLSRHRGERYAVSGVVLHNLVVMISLAAKITHTTAKLVGVRALIP